MWKCEKCGRSFRNVNQSHFCGEKPESVDEFIGEYEPEIQEILNQVREALREVLPDAQEKISWSMPTFWQGFNIIHFAPAKNHLGIYPGSQPIIHFKEELKGYKTSKGAIQFPYKDPIPMELIQKIAIYSLEYQLKEKEKK